MAIIARDAGMKPGYKLTEVGVIPEDWKVKSLQELGVWKGGATPSMSNASFWTDGVIFWASSSDIRANVLSSTASMITEAAIKQSSTTLLKEDAILIVTRSGILRRYLPIAKNIVPVAINQDIKALIPNSQTNADYLLQILSERGPDILSRCMKSGTTVESIEYTWLKKYQIPLPPLPEQRAIATALSDVDALIASLDKLIAKKRDIKQATMQQLLTGKTRLSGFSGEWKKRKLGEIAEIKMGKTPSRRNSAYWGRGYKWLSIADLKSKYISETKEEITKLATLDMTVIPRGTLVMSFKLTIGKLAFTGCDMYSNEAICSFTKLQASAEYMYYVLSQIDFSLYGKQAVKGYTLNMDSLNSVEIPYPSLAEQHAIATILSDMDAEIAALERRRDKTRALKQGMMQELLTGKTRL
jgi:type I restriction enzyme S subunit